MYEKELQRILTASQNNALTFFVGAGVSALSGAPTWKRLIHAISDRLGQARKDEYSSDEYLQIPQMFYYSLGENKEEYYTFVKAQLHSSPMLPNVIHREMLNLNPVSFITTNYDTLLEDAAVQYCQSFKVVSRDEDVPTIFGDRFILKLHGDFKHNNFVLKEEDYLNYSDNFKLIETLVKSIFSTNTVVFIGYSLNDYNIKLILNWTKTLLKDSFREPIFLYVGSQALTDTEIIYHQSKGLLVIEWNKLIASTDVYLDRYTAIFAALKNQSELSLDGKSEDDAFEILYNLLQPLGCLNALRIEDVSKRLYPYVIIGDDGVIRLSNNLFQMNRQITQHYYGYVSNNQQKKLITWANKQSRTNFSFDLFEMLVQCDARMSKATKTQLKIFLRQRIAAAQENNNNGIVVYPNKHPYEELDQVGYWCLINVLNAKDFREFLGNSAAFDFYCEYTKFDFNKFDVPWLLNLYPHTLEQIAKNEKVKGCVRVAIANALNDGEIALSDSQRLQSILIKHFC